MTAVKFSAVIVSLNEERNIGECIDSLGDVADEIIVLDSFSTDRTAAICRMAEVTFIQREWQGYSASKNYANGLASGDYIISLDADEALSPELADSILKIRNMPVQDVAFTMNRLNNFFGMWIRHGDWYPDKKLRIFRRPAGHWEGIVHERLILPRNTKIIHLKGDLLHNASTSVSEYVRKSWHYAHLVARSDFEQGRIKTWLYHGAIKPVSLFVRSYFLKLGFLDGYRGLLLAAIAAWERHVRYVAFRKFKKRSRSTNLSL
jgi:glycosyltransferase involved in cell wall biosynthesis